MEQAHTSVVEEQGEQEPRTEGRMPDRGEGRMPDRGERRPDDRRPDDRRPESFEQMLRRFKKSVDNAGILKEVRARSYFESKSQKARRKAAKAARRRTRNKGRSAE